MNTVLVTSPAPAVPAASCRAGRAPSAAAGVSRALAPQPRPERLPLSHAQQRLWFIHKLGISTSAYNMPVGLRLRGPLEVSTLERAINAVIARHEALRTRFEEIDGEPAQ